jgi:NAD(P)-dependent dehydrogenase (short-subunit alcohol dehydrogenase family)
LALELGPLRVNTIRPSLIDSDMWDFLDDEPRERLRQNTRKTSPVRRIAHIRRLLDE